MSNYLRELINGPGSTHAYYDADETHVVAVMESAQTPAPSLNTYVTASLHDVPNFLDDRDVRVELLMVGDRGSEAVANVVATSAFFVMKNRWLGAPGVVFPNAVREFFPNTTVPHVLWVEPLDFTDLQRLTVDGLSFTVHVLQGLPISDQERALLLSDGYGSLMAWLQDHEIDHFDLQRASVI